MFAVLNDLVLLFLKFFFAPCIIFISVSTWGDEFKKTFFLKFAAILYFINLLLPSIPLINPLIKITVFLVLIIILFYNRHLSPWGYLLTFIGNLSNKLVIFVNHNKMPTVDYDVENTLFASNYMQISEVTNLNILADWIPILGTYANIGDFVIWYGLFTLIYEILRYKKIARNKMAT